MGHSATEFSSSEEMKSTQTGKCTKNQEKKEIWICEALFKLNVFLDIFSYADLYI